MRPAILAGRAIMQETIIVYYLHYILILLTLALALGIAAWLDRWWHHGR